MNKKSVKTGALTFLLAFIVSLFIFIGAIFVWFGFVVSIDAGQPSNVIVEEEPKSTISEKLAVPRKTNFLLVGVDQGDLLTDTIIVGTFDSKLEEFTLISIPRDTHVDMSYELQQEMAQDGIYLPQHTKINSINSYAGGDEQGIYYLEKYLEELLAIEIDYYAEMNTEAFIDIVDAVGGIDMEIREQGYQYYDPTQDLVIDVPGGMQHLDGEMAEGVVRFRSDYTEGDIDRISVQQEFMEAFFDQVLEKGIISTDSIEVVATCIGYTDTNVSISDAALYLPYISALNADSISMVTAPGEARTIEDISYYIVDDQALTEISSLVFYGQGIQKASEEISEFSIQILNGSGVAGLASAKKAALNSLGYKVQSIGNYHGPQEASTRIYSTENIDTTELDRFFTDVNNIKVDDTQTEYDIVIVLGTLEK